MNSKCQTRVYIEGYSVIYCFYFMFCFIVCLRFYSIEFNESFEIPVLNKIILVCLVSLSSTILIHYDDFVRYYWQPIFLYGIIIIIIIFVARFQNQTRKRKKQSIWIFFVRFIFSWFFFDRCLSNSVFEFVFFWPKCLNVRRRLTIECSSYDDDDYRHSLIENIKM